MKRIEVSKIATALAKAVVSPDSPAREVISNPWLFVDIMELVKPQIGFIMVSGGFGVKTTQIYSVSTNSWINGPDLPDYRHSHEMALVGNEIFVIGGFTDHDASKSVISITIPDDIDSFRLMKWKVMPNLNLERMTHGVGVVDGKIFVIGGFDGSRALKTVEVFSVKEGKWSAGPEMSTARKNMGVSVIGKKIYVIGGCNYHGGLSSAEVLDTETNKWSTLPSMEIHRNEMGITVIDDRFIWIIGGWNGGDYGHLDSITIFDVEKNEWLAAPIKLPRPKFWLNSNHS
jgi:kelch-like protein 2/3